MQLPECELTESKSQRVNILHLSDLHFKGDTNPRLHLAHFENTLRRSAKELRGKFDLILVTGDLVDYPEKDPSTHRDALLAARSYLLQLAAEYCINRERGLAVIPGNHDYRWHGVKPEPDAIQRFQEVFGEYFGHRIFKCGSQFPLLVACFDSNKPSPSGGRLDFARGCIDISQIDSDARYFEEAAAAYPNLHRIALVHHHPFPVPRAERVVLQNWGDKLGWLEKLTGVPIDGAPEYMLLRNAGVFVNKMFENRFSMILHGHFHEPGYWRLNTPVGKSGSTAIDVVGAASILDGEERGFNTITLSHDGSRHIRHYVWHQPSGDSRPNIEIQSAAYDNIRAEVGTASTEPVAAKVYSQIWTVDLDKGDWEIAEYNSGYHAVDPDQSVGSMTLQTVSEPLNRTEFEVRKMPLGERLPVTARMDPATKDAIHYEIPFEPRLQHESSVNILSRYLHRGALYRSREDKECCGKKDRPEFEFLYQELTRKVDRMFIKLRFKGSALSQFPRSVFCEVYDGEKLSKAERESQFVAFDFWEVPPDAGMLQNGQIEREALLTVIQPRLRYRYQICWDLPSDPNFFAVPVRRAWKTWLDHKSWSDDRWSELFNNLRSIRPLKDMPPDDVAFSMFGFDRDSRKLVKIGSEQPSPPFPKEGFQYGRDVIGGSFRRQEPLLFWKRDPNFTHYRRDTDDGLEFLAAVPVLRSFPGIGPRAIGVLALHSQNPDSSLYECCGQSGILDEIQTVLAATFR